MSSISVFRRTEKKYRTDAETYRKLIPLLEQHMELDPFCSGGRPYQICNLYYDTAHDDVIRESLKKPFYKEKLRMRSYGFPADDNAEVFLELKKKIDGVVMKRRATLPYGKALRFMKDTTIPEDLSYINRQVLREIREYLFRIDIRTSTLLTYERMAWFGKEDSRFRLTFDYNIRYLRGATEIRPCLNIPAGLSGNRRKQMHRFDSLFSDDFMLMEAKVENAFPLWFSHLIGQEKIYPQSFSKYGVAYKNYLKNERFGGDETIDILGYL